MHTLPLPQSLLAALPANPSPSSNRPSTPLAREERAAPGQLAAARWGRRLAAGPLALALLLMAGGLTPAQAAGRNPLPGHRPALVASLAPQARLEPTSRMKLSIHLPLRNEGALTAFLGELYNPDSPQYHHYLTPEEFDARFGPTEADYQTLVDFVRITDRRSKDGKYEGICW